MVCRRLGLTAPSHMAVATQPILDYVIINNEGPKLPTRRRGLTADQFLKRQVVEQLSARISYQLAEKQLNLVQELKNSVLLSRPPSSASHGSACLCKTPSSTQFNPYIMIASQFKHLTSRNGMHTPHELRGTIG